MYSNWYSVPLSDLRVNLRGSVFILIYPFYFRLLVRTVVLHLGLVVLRFAPADTNLKVFLVILTFRTAIVLFEFNVYILVIGLNYKDTAFYRVVHMLVSNFFPP